MFTNHTSELDANVIFDMALTLTANSLSWHLSPSIFSNLAISLVTDTGMSMAKLLPSLISCFVSLTHLLTSSTPMWNASGSRFFVRSFPLEIGFEGFLQFWTNLPAAYVSLPAYTLTFLLLRTSSGRYSNNAASFLGSDGSNHPSVGPQTLDNGSANNIFPPCLYRFSTIESRSATSANFHALNCPLLERLFSNKAGLWSVYKVIPASMFVSIKFLNLSNARIRASDSL